jgi:RNA polymerase sigma-70 factor (ECF subfamily)
MSGSAGSFEEATLFGIMERKGGVSRRRRSVEGEMSDHAQPMDEAVEPGPGDAELRESLHRQVLRFCPAELRAQADDIVQIAWMRLDRARKKSERNRRPGATLIARVAFCATMDEKRQLWRRRERPLEDKSRQTSQAAERPDRAAEAAEIRRAIGDCLVGMSENRSLAVTLYLLGHTAPATARLLGWSVSNTENLIYRGLADLRRCLTGKGFTP